MNKMHHNNMFSYSKNIGKRYKKGTKTNVLNTQNVHILLMNETNVKHFCSFLHQNMTQHSNISS